MLMDSRAEFTSGASMIRTASATAFNIGNVIDTQVGSANTLQNLGEDPIYLVISITASIITAGTAGTLVFRLVSDAVNPPDTGTATVHFTSPTYVTDDDALNSLDAGMILVFALPRQKTYEKYLGLQAIAATTDTTAGSIVAFLSDDARTWAAYADAIN
jgi:hypothetical protein